MNLQQRQSRLASLFRANRTKPRAYAVRAAEADADEATVYLYDIIDPFWGVSAEQFAKDLNAITAARIHLRINSPGGDVFEGRAIATAIREHKSEVISHIDGLAASAASFIALAADQVRIAQGAMVMIHFAWALGIGNRDDMRKLADLLEKIDGTLVDEYVRETGQARAQVEAWMAAETWFTAAEAIETGFADALAGEDDEEGEEEEPEEAAAARTTRWDLSAYANAPGARAELEARAAALGLAIVPQQDLTRAAGAAHAERSRRLALVERQQA